MQKEQTDKKIADRKLYLKKYMGNKYKREKTKSMEMLGGVICVYCGCDDIRALEINHKNLGENDYIKKKGAAAHYRAICEGMLRTDNLEVCCRVCNHRHYLKTKYGIDKHVVIWVDKNGF